MMEIKLLKQEYFNLPDDTDLKDALNLIIDLQEETQELEISLPMGKINSALGSEKVLQPSSEELTVEPQTHAVALASTKRDISWGSEKGLLPTTVIYINGHQRRLKLRCVFDSASESSFLTLHAAERLGLDNIKTDFTVQDINSSSAKINYLARAFVFQIQIEHLI
ncbi:uncharacterized protein TNCV_1067981 [Trichonephila clavipes]|nr:uncharacterized protein TNCV_1067981 [Trichonephila clavipes]